MNIENKEKKSILVINPVGGLANRMRSIASGVSLACDLDMDYRVVWLRNWETGALYDEIFAIPTLLEHKIECPSALKYNLLYSIPRKKNLYITKLTRRIYDRALYDTLPPLSVMQRYDNLSLNRWQAMLDVNNQIKKIFIQAGTDFYDYSRQLYRQLFKLRPELAAEVDRVLTQLGDHKIGIHIRRTDNAKSIANSPDHLFETRMQTAIDRCHDVKFYLATDSDDVKRKFVNRFGDRIIYNNNTARRDTLGGIKDAAVDMYVLAGCDSISGSYYSSFSEAASILGDKPLTIVKQVIVTGGEG